MTTTLAIASDGLETVDHRVDPASARWKRLALRLGVPAAWAGLLLFHPTGDGEVVFPVISQQLGRWQAVHLGMAVFIPLFAYAVFTLATGINGIAGRIGRVLLPTGAVLYGVYEAALGVGTGALVSHVEDLSGADHAVGAGLVEDYFMQSPIFRFLELSGSLALGGGIIATAIALRHAGLIGRSALWLMVVAVVPITWHVPPFGPVGLLLFVAAMLLSRRSLLSGPSRSVPEASRIAAVAE